jgi:23S rRNA (uracil1939-C5)-methyltransferase
MLETVAIQKLVHGGQGLGVLKDGRKVFVWNALPGETVGVRVGRKKRDYAEGFAEEIVEPSSERVEPQDEAYLSTSPWQIMTFEAENRHKKEILAEAFMREKVELPAFEFVSVGEPLHYRNKMEYSFWGDDDGLHLALFHRASHGKRIVQGSSIARPEIDKVANNIVAILNKNGVRASQLKTIVVRTSKTGDTVAALFVKDKNFPVVNELKGICKGVSVIFSNPKSPASIVTKELYKFGGVTLEDELLGQKIRYDVISFFQVNLPIFEFALKEITDAAYKSRKLVDMYAGVGTIGVCVGAKQLVEIDEQNVNMAKQNLPDEAEVILASTEQALDYITPDVDVVFDPPRAGLHSKVIDRLLEAKPQKIVYLSCNPATQARDIAKLLKEYKIKHFTGYNFFPRTPHIESLAILEKSV